ncbi:hypothetical protein CHN51_07970 [Sphingorhabdus sp. YGSMI21]|nr:hypothetical protein CHN51_07970 [Sphingorhabdus sp. YGSMI21]
MWREGLQAFADLYTVGATSEANELFIFAIVDEDTREINKTNIADYPDSLGSLTSQSWETSICVWEDGHWTVLIDLCDGFGDVTDLVLHMTIYEQGANYKVIPGLIYVP